MDYEMTVFTMIAHSGEAKSSCMEAIGHAKHSDFEKAEACIEEANRKLSLVHETQTSLIQSEAQGNETKLTLLMIHAQDHLMNAMTIRDLAGEFVDMYRALRNNEAVISSKLR
ncbi:MAG: phosphotransferase system lactose/cellobiose-specific subunit [Clostridia bacterium]|jgi:PTS system cellobiose-specific IIA component|nr:phosphotransferase system lactose/cellobiose-specific subunit [Clostridia bacterium]